MLLLSLLHAQDAATFDQPAQAVAADETRQIWEAIFSIKPFPASATPDIGKFYTVQHGDEWPPMPGNVLNLPFWNLGDGVILLDDRNVDYAALRALADAEAAKLKKKSPGGGMQMMSMISSPGSTPVYLTNLVATFTNNAMTVSFDIAGGTNGFSYDIYSTTNIADSPAYLQWTWLGQGYTTNTYTFTNQPLDYAFYILAIPRQTTVVAWGDNRSGQCNVPSGLTNAIDVAGGFNFSLALKADGTVVAWGDNSYGQCDVPAGLTNVVSISANWQQSAAVRSDGTVVTWGQTNGVTPANLTNAISISVGNGNVLALRNDGTIAAWGSSLYGQTNVPTGLGPLKQIAAGEDHSVALLTNGMVAVWGYDGTGFGWNITNVPTGLSNVVAIAAGTDHTLALKANGTVTAWGAGKTNNGTLGNFGQSIVPAGLSNVVAVAGGGYHSLALQADGTVAGWGDDLFGQNDSPQGLNGVKAIAAGTFHTLTIRSGRLTPVILGQPGDQYAPTGGTVTFSSLGAGVAGVQYQWQFNGVNISGATSANLTLTNVLATSEGSYRVVISNNAGSVTSDAATFTLVRPPQVVSFAPALGIRWITNYTPDIAQIPFSVAATNAGQWKYPVSYRWSFNGTNTAGATNANFSLALYPWFSSFSEIYSTNFTFSNGIAPLEGTYTVTLTNAAGSTNLSWNIKLALPGMVAAWGDDAYGECDRPVTLTNTLALAAGLYHSVAVRDNGTIIQWGDYQPDDFQTPNIPTPVGSPPTNSDIVTVVAGIAHDVALKADGTVIQWGLAGANGLKNFPTNLTGVKAIGAGYERSLALLTNGSIVDWGYFVPIFGLDQRVPGDLTNATGIACGAYHNLAVRGDGTVESWGYNASGQTDVPAGLSNVVAVAGGGRHSLALKVDGTVVAWGDNTYGQCTVPASLSNVLAIAAGYFHSVALKNDGTMVAWGYNSAGQTNVPVTLTQTKMIAAGGYHTLAGQFSPLVQYPVDVTKDLLLIYNSNSTDSSNACAYYLANRPLVANANVLGVACDVGEFFTSSNNCDTQIVAPVLNWLTNHPTKHPEYIILFYDIPTRLPGFEEPAAYGSVSYHLHNSYPGWLPFVNNINAGSLADCKAYVDKLAHIGTNYSPGNLIISASAGGFGNTNYCFDNTGYLGDLHNDPEKNPSNAVLQTGASSASVIYTNVTDIGLASHITVGSDIAGYLSEGFHSSLGNYYATNGYIQWAGNSSWWIIETIESFNGQRAGDGGNFIKWFSSNAFGGTNYSNTPVGAVCHTEEPGYNGVENGSVYFGLWQSGKNFAGCAWNSKKTPFFQAVGDPLITK